MTNIPQSQKMTHKRFKDIIASYGVDEKCWPADERDAMHVLLTSVPSLQTHLDEAQSLDQLLNLAPLGDDGPAQISEAFMDRLMAVPSEHKQAQPTSEASFGFFVFLMEAFQVKTKRALAPRIAGLATAAIMGVMVGTTSMAQIGQSKQIIDASELMMGDAGLIRDLKELN